MKLKKVTLIAILIGTLVIGILFGYSLSYKQEVSPEILSYQHDIYTLGAIRDLYKETLIEHDIPIPKYVPKSPHIKVAETSSLVITQKLGESQYNWSEIFDSPEEAVRYLKILKYTMETYGANIIQPPDPFVYGSDAYPMLWHMSVSLPTNLDDTTARQIHNTLEQLGVWDDIRSTDEFWRLRGN